MSFVSGYCSVHIEHNVRLSQPAVRRCVLGLCFLWSLFQVYTASAIPFVLSDWFGLNLVFNNQEVRQIHLAFAMALAMLIYPLRTADRESVPWLDWIAAGIAALCCLYLLWFKDQIADRSGLPITADLWVSGIGLVMLGLALFRALGLPLLVVSSVFLLYVFFGDQPFLPETMQWKGASLNKALWHFWMQTEGVFGVALGVASSMIFLFVLFGALLERAGAGLYFIQLAYSLLGHLRGGPAKAAVVASGLSGIYSGSSIANVVSTGTFTIPLMKQTGFSPEKAGAVEVAASTNGQLTPPVMGAAAFLIAEFTGVSYTDLIRHALLPALVSYIGLMYIVHLEAVKLGLQGMPSSNRALPWLQRYTAVLAGFFGVALLGGLVHLGLGWTQRLAPGLSIWLGVCVFVGLYLGSLWLAARHPDVEELDHPDAFQTVMPAREILPRGLHYLVPIAVLLWCILVERLSPTLSAFWGTLAITTVILTQTALKRWFRGHGFELSQLTLGVRQAVAGMIQGAENMVGIGVATAVAGIIIGTVSLTGAHQVIGELVEALSGGSLIAMLLLVAVMSLILGMGLPTTANYIVVSSLMAPVIVSLGAQSGLFVPLVAVHLFVFYFGILADDTPPVGLAAFAASAISQGDPIRTGIQGFTYDIRTAILPFLFIFNTELLLIDVTWLKGLSIFVIAAVAMMLFAAATQGFWLTRSKLWETVGLLLVAFTLVRPGYWIDQLQPPWIAQSLEPATLETPVYSGSVQLVFEGPDFDDIERETRYVLLTSIPEGEGLIAFLETQGLVLQVSDGVATLDEPFPGTNYFQDLQRFDFYGDRPVTLTMLSVRNMSQWTKEWMYLPAFFLLLLILGSQRSRVAREVVHA
ncbi:MAG: TRAP transporter fused permease subunit [Gammaproteobacteria bacterium]|nr:TRAP transporter fused permease subunit [Gammaproteobacteria bacterium]